MAIGVELSRLMTIRSAWEIEQGRKNTFYASIAKAFASETAVKAASDAVQVINRRTQTNLRRDRRRACFHLVWQFCKRRLLKRNGLDHIAAALERIHLFENFCFAVDDSASRWRVHFMTRKRIEVAVKLLDIDF